MRHPAAGMSAGAAVLLAALSAAAQGPPGGPPSEVGFTEVVAREVHKEVRLSGTVESRTSSMVASEVEGVVESVSAREGDSVATGQTLARLRTTNLELRLRAATGQLKEANARLELSKSNLARAQDLFDSGVVSQREYDDAVSEFAAREGRIDELTAEIDRIRVDLERCSIKAPFDGAVVRERTEIGQWVNVGDPIADLVSLSRVEVLVDVPERYFPTLVSGTRARVTFESMPGNEVEGRVTAIIRRADAQARTFPVKVRIPNRDRKIGVGMLAQVSLPLGERYQAKLVPKDAVTSQGPSRVVLRINDDDTVGSVNVQVGQGVGSWIIVEGPLEAGQRVITRGNERVQPGQPVAGTLVEYELP